MTLITRLSIEDCKARLAAGIGPWTFLQGEILSHRNILGTLHGEAFKLRVNGGLRHSAPTFYGRFTSSNDSTLIQGDFDVSFVSKIPMVVRLSMLVLFALISLVLLLTRQTGMEDAGKMLLFIGGLAVFAYGSRRMKQKAILNFLKDKLEASDSETNYGTEPPYLYSQATRPMSYHPLAFGTKRVLIILAWTAGVYFGSNAIITGILVGITFGICHHGHLNVHSYLTAHLTLVDLFGTVLNVFCLLLAVVVLVLALCGCLPGTKNASPPLYEKSQPSRTRKIFWIAAVSAIIAGFVAWAIYGSYATFTQGTTSGPDFISAIQSNLVTTNTISSIEVVEPTRGYMPFTSNELDSLPRRAKINSLATINRLFKLLKGAQRGMWARNMNHPGSIYEAWLKVNTKHGFFWLYCNVEEDDEGAFFTIESNTRNGTNPNGTTSYYLDNFSEALVILSNGPLWIIEPAHLPSQSGSAYFHWGGFKYDFYDSKSNRFATVTLNLPSPIMEAYFYGWWYGSLVKSYVRPQTHDVLASDKLKVNFGHFICSRDLKDRSVATINLNAFDPDDCITLSMPVSNQPVTGHWVYSIHGGMVDSGTFTGPIQ